MFKFALIFLLPFFVLACAPENSTPPTDQERFNQMKATLATKGVFLSGPPESYEIYVLLGGVGPTDAEMRAAAEGLRESYNTEFTLASAVNVDKLRRALRDATIELQEKRTKLLAKTQNCEATGPASSPMK